MRQNVKKSGLTTCISSPILDHYKSIFLHSSSIENELRYPLWDTLVDTELTRRIEKLDCRYISHFTLDCQR